MRFAEELTAINMQYIATRRSAKRHPLANGFTNRGASGIRRDRVDARASREYRAKLKALGIHPAW